MATTLSDRDVFLNEFVPNVEQSTIAYSKWKQQQPGELAAWTAYVAAIRRGESPVPPGLSTRVGKFLAAAGKMAVDPVAPPPPSAVRYPSSTRYPSEVMS